MPNYQIDYKRALELSDGTPAVLHTRIRNKYEYVVLVDNDEAGEAALQFFDQFGNNSDPKGLKLRNADGKTDHYIVLNKGGDVVNEMRSLVAGESVARSYRSERAAREAADAVEGGSILFVRMDGGAATEARVLA